MSDRPALEDLFKATLGKTWENNLYWLSEQRYGLWFGITVNLAGHVEQLKLTDNRLEGHLPDTDSWRLLVNMERLYLNGNSIKGCIPEKLSLAASLQELNLAWNQLSGEIPVSLFTLEQLLILRLDNNQLEGEVSPQLARLQNLKQLDLSRNKLRGPFPLVGSRMPQLQVLLLTGNDFDAPTPTSIRQWRQLEAAAAAEELNTDMETIPTTAIT